MKTIEITSKMYLRHRETLEAWVAHHDVVLEDTPVPSKVAIDGDRVTFERFLRNGDGNLFIPDGSDEPARATVTVPLRRPFPADVS